MAFQWTEDLATGVVMIDEQHKGIFNQLNTLLSAMDQGKGSEEEDKVLGFLEDYITKHFHDEEELMTTHTYAGYSLQKADHTQFMKDFYRLKKEFTQSGITLHLVVQTQQQLGNWLMDHIKTKDKELALFLKGKT